MSKVVIDFSMFDYLNKAPIDLEATKVVAGTGVTHLTYKVVK